MIRFDVKNDENIEIENVKNEINDKKIIESNDVKNEIKINEFETTNFDFFV